MEGMGIFYDDYRRENTCRRGNRPGQTPANQPAKA